MVSLIGEVGTELPKKSVEELLSLVRSILGMVSSAATVNRNKPQFRLSVIYFLYLSVLNTSFNTTDREAD